MKEQDLSSPTPSERATALWKPYRYTIEWCSVETGLDNAGRLYDLVTHAIEKFGGFPQGGLVEQMELDDVVPDSPLAKALEAGSEGSPTRSDTKGVRS